MKTDYLKTGVIGEVVPGILKQIQFLKSKPKLEITRFCSLSELSIEEVRKESPMIYERIQNCLTKHKKNRISVYFDAKGRPEGVIVNIK